MAPLNKIVNFEILGKGINPIIKKDFSDSGFDILSPQDLIFKPFEKKVVNMGVAYHLPKGYGAKIEVPSSVANLHEIIALGTVCDFNYRGEIKAILKNLSNEEQIIKTGSKLIQLVVYQVYTGPWRITDGIFKVSDERGLRSNTSIEGHSYYCTDSSEFETVSEADSSKTFVPSLCDVNPESVPSVSRSVLFGPCIVLKKEEDEDSLSSTDPGSESDSASVKSGASLKKTVSRRRSARLSPYLKVKKALDVITENTQDI